MVEGWVGLSGWSQTKVVYPHIHGHPSKYYKYNIQIQNQFVTRRSVQAKKNGIGGTRGDCYWEWSVYTVEKSSRLRLRLKLLTQVAARQLKRRVIPDLWRTNRQCLVRHDEGHVRMAKQHFVRWSWAWRRVTLLIKNNALPLSQAAITMPVIMAALRSRCGHFLAL